MILLSLHAFFFLHLHFKFTFTFTFLHQRSPVTFVTFVTFVIASQSFYFFTFLPLNALLPLNCVPTQPLLRRDVSGTASGRSHRYVVTQFQMHLEGVKNTENPGCNSERRTFRFVKYLSIVYGIVNFLPVCASTV